MKRRALVCLLLVVASTGCGKDAEEDVDGIAGQGRWLHARIEGVSGATGIAALEGHLLLSVASERAVFDVPFQASEVRDGAVV